MLHNFGPDNDLKKTGDFRGAEIQRNVIDCGPQLCVFGIQVGPNPWNAKLTVIGGDVHDNDVRGAKVGINIDGGGVLAAPVVVRDNVVTAVPADEYFSDCARPIETELINISPNSIVERKDDLGIAGARLSDACQLTSQITAAD
jgi:hypothetical protein